MCRPRAPQWLRTSVPRAPFPGPGGHSYPSPPCGKRNPPLPFPRKNQLLSLPPAPKAPNKEEGSLEGGQEYGSRPPTPSRLQRINIRLPPSLTYF